MDRFTGGCLCGNVESRRRDSHTGSAFVTVSTAEASSALFHASAVFPQDAVTIEGETRDYAGRFFCPPLRLVRFLTQLGRSRSEPGIPGCP